MGKDMLAVAKNIIGRTAAEQKNHFLLTWEGVATPLGSCIDNVEIGWAHSGIIAAKGTGQRIGYYERLMEFGGKNGRTQVMAISTDGTSITPPTGGSVLPSIHYAASHGDLETVRYWLRYSKELINEKNSMGETPLHEAAFLGRTEVVKFLLEQGADVNAEAYNQKRTPLELAMSLMDNAPIVELLIARGATVPEKLDYLSPEMQTVVRNAANGKPSCAEQMQILWSVKWLYAGQNTSLNLREAVRRQTQLLKNTKVLGTKRKKKILSDLNRAASGHRSIPYSTVAITRNAIKSASPGM